MLPMVAFLCLSILLTADIGSAGQNIFGNNEEQCFVTMVVNMALELQKQSQQLEKLQDKAEHLELGQEWTSGNLTGTSDMQSKIDRSLQQQSSDLHILLSGQEWNMGNLTILQNARHEQDRILKQQSGDLRSLREKVEPMESRLKWSRQQLAHLGRTLSTQDSIVQQQSTDLKSLKSQVSVMDIQQQQTTAEVNKLNESCSEQDRILQQQRDEVSSLQDQVTSVLSHLDWITANPSAINTRAEAAYAVSGKECPSGWRSYGQSCYLYRHEADSWLHAKAFCEAVHGYLVEIKSADENNFVKDLLVEHQAGAAWLGLQDFVVEGEFVWTTDEQRAEYTNWDDGEPNNNRGIQDCGNIRASGFWDDGNCDAGTHLAIVCERGPVGENIIG